HRVVSTASTSLPGIPIPFEPTTPASGLALLPYGDGLVLLALDANAGSSIVYTSFDGSTWSSWQTVVTLGTSGSWLSGYAPGRGARPAVIWTQAAPGASYAIAGALLP